VFLLCGFSEGRTPGVRGLEMFHAWIIQVKEPRTVQFFLFGGVSETLARWLVLDLLLDSCGFAHHGTPSCIDFGEDCTVKRTN